MRIASDAPIDQSPVLDALRSTWGFDTLRPLQWEAIEAGLRGRDSLVVLPTGGGKSLCFQVPPLVAGRTDVVVSPLIALMKDQVDGLRANGYPAAALYGGMDREDLLKIERDAREGRLRLLFAAPERLLSPPFMRLMSGVRVGAFAVDEAHCISHWGHDFRAEYRRLRELRDRFPRTPMHAFTATATKRVREDIIAQLDLRDPLVAVGSFDRPNLTYRVQPRTDLIRQVGEALRRRRGEAAIIYCISRRDTEELAASLKALKLRAAHYHAGMTPDQRRRTQEAFANERLDVIVATVAFGMGIDRSDVRLVLHAAMPKSIEHYQQEAGRAGRDGLPAECLLLYSPADAMRWERLMERNVQEASANGPEAAEAAEVHFQANVAQMNRMRAYCTLRACRHRALVEYFNQRYENGACGACDVCLGEISGLEDRTVDAQMVLSCVARVEQRFGAGHVVEVLAGADTERVRRNRHERLSTFGLMKDRPREQIQQLLHALFDHGLLRRSPDEFPVVQLTPEAAPVLRGQARVMLPGKRASTRAARVEENGWDGVDRGLFEALRGLRREIAGERGVPPFVVFGDATLRDLARRRPRDEAGFLAAHGVGRRKLNDFGERFLRCIREWCVRNGDSREMVREEDAAFQDADPSTFEQDLRNARKKRVSAARQTAMQMFAEAATMEEVSQAVQRRPGTVAEYLAEYIAAEGPESIDHWVSPADYQAIAAAAEQHGTERLTPIYVALEQRIPFETIRVVLAHIGVVRER